MLLGFVLLFLCSASSQKASSWNQIIPNNVQLVFKINSLAPVLQYEGELKINILDDGTNQSVVLFERGLHVESASRFVNLDHNASSDVLRLDVQGLDLNIPVPISASFKNAPSWMNLGQKGFSVILSDSGRVFGRTCFSPTFARTVFPSTSDQSGWVNFTATFELSKKFKLLFVGQPDTSSVSLDTKTVKFQPTDPMLPRSVGWVVFEESGLEKVVSSNHQVHMWYRPDQKTFNVTKVLERVFQYLDFMQDLVSSEFTISNQTLKIVVLPVKAIEPCTSWSLVSLSEDSVLEGVELEKALTRLWLGNLITNENPVDDWLVEGLVKYITYFIWEVPGYDSSSHFLMDDFFPAFDRDFGPFPVTLFEGPASLQTRDLEERDGVVGSKGVALIKTYEAILGLETNILVIKQLFNNSRSSRTISGIKLIHYIMNIMEGQSTQLAVTNKTLDYGFLLVNIVLQASSNFTLRLTLDLYDYFGNKTMEIYSGDMIPEFETMNPHIFCRYNMSGSLWEDAITGLTNPRSNMTMGEKLRYLDDSFTLARLNLLSYDIAMNVSTLLRYENNNIIFKRALKHFLHIKDVLSYNSSLQDIWKGHVRSLIKFTQIKPYEKYSPVSELCEFDYCKSLERPSTKTMDLSLNRREIFCYNLQNELYSWEEVKSVFNKSQDTIERQFWLRVLPCSRRKEALSWLLNEVQTSTQEISAHEILEIIMSSNRRVLNFFNILSVHNTADGVIRFLVPDYELLRFFSRLAEVIPTTEDLNKLIMLMKSLEGDSTVLNDEKIEQLKAHSEWRLRNDMKVAQRIVVWMSSNPLPQSDPNSGPFNRNVPWFILISLSLFLL